MKRLGAGLLTLLLFPLILAGCEQGVLTDPGPLTVSIEQSGGELRVDRTVVFEVNARGGGLERLITRYGDGSADTTVAFGATSVGRTAEHVYQEAGSYEAEAWIFTISGDSLSDRVLVTIQD